MIINAEKVSYHAQALMMFLNISKEAKTLPQDFVERAKTACIEIMGKAEKDSEKAAKELNQLIQEMNQSLSAPYPQLMTDSMENLVKAEIAAFEHFLNQELKANALTIQEEVPLFNDSLHLWESIGISLSPQEGIAEFALLIKKLNALLPEEKKYPSPDESQY